jgi:hypothetical protein
VRRGPPEGLLGQLVRGYVARHATPLTHVERHLLCVHTEQASPRAPSDPGASIPAPPARAGRPSDAGRASHKYGFVFGTGAVCGYLAEYYAGGTPNARVAARTLLRGVGSALVGGPMSRRMAAPFRGSVHLPDGVVWEERDYLAVAAGTIDQIGLNFRPFRRYAEAADHFHVLGIHASAIGFVTELPRIWRAAPMRPEHTFEAVTPRMTLRSPRQPFRYMIDGDLHQCEGALHVAIGPKVRIVVEADRARADAAEGQLRGNAGAVGESIAGAAR